MSDFDTTSRLVIARARRMRRSKTDAIDADLGPSLAYLAASGDWDGEGWGHGEIGPAANWQYVVDNRPLEDTEYWMGQWDARRWRLLAMPVAAKMLDIAAHTGSPYQAQVVLNRALRSCGADQDDAAGLTDFTLGAIRNIYMRDREAALIAAMRAEHAALYRMAASGLDALSHHLPRWMQHAYF